MHICHCTLYVTSLQSRAMCTHIHTYIHTQTVFFMLQCNINVHQTKCNREANNNCRPLREVNSLKTIV